MKAIVIEGSLEEIKEMLGKMSTQSAVLVDESPSVQTERVQTEPERRRHFTKQFPSRKSYLGGMRHKDWTKEEDKFLLENYGTMSKDKLAKALDRTKKAVFVRKTILQNFTHESTIVSARTKNAKKAREWSDREIEFLKKNVGKMSLRDMGAKLKRSYVTISIKLKKLGIPQSKYVTWRIHNSA